MPDDDPPASHPDSASSNPVDDDALEDDDIVIELNSDDPERSPSARCFRMSELKKAASDPNHPDHEAALAGAERLRRIVQGVYPAGFNEQLQRTLASITALTKPTVSMAKFTALALPDLNKGSEEYTAGLLDKIAKPPPLALDIEVSDLPERHLQATLDVLGHTAAAGEVMREQRDEERARRQRAEVGEQEARKVAKRSMWGTWVAVPIALAALAVAVVALLKMP